MLEFSKIPGEGNLYAVTSSRGSRDGSVKSDELKTNQGNLDI